MPDLQIGANGKIKFLILRYQLAQMTQAKKGEVIQEAAPCPARKGQAVHDEFGFIDE